MSSLWTPYGEDPVGGQQGEQPPQGGAPPGAGGPGGEELDPEQMRQMLARLAATPVEAIVTQFAVELQEIAILHLGLSAERPESLGQAALAIDAMGTLVDGLGDRLEPNAEPLRQALAQLRLGFVDARNQAQPGAEAPEAEAGTDEGTDDA